ncbi:MAG: hypothetical protein IPK88_18225 [Saprospiraceae bacterium]|nr:hypothetical protein [Candidatus Defluviibacterium haderslevense]
MKELTNLELLELYLRKFPFRDRLFYHYFVKLEGAEISFDDFEDWFYDKNNQYEIEKIIGSNKESITKNLKISNEELKEERKKASLMFPSIESLYTPIGLFDN